MAWTQVVTAFVAVLGLGLSVFNLYLRWRDQRPRIEVELGFGVTSGGPRLFTINVVNAGKVAATIREIYLSVGEDERGERRMYMPSLSTGLSGGDSLPLRLDPGQPGSFHQRLPELQNDLRSEGYEGAAEVTAVVKDTLGNRFTKQIKIRL